MSSPKTDSFNKYKNTLPDRYEKQKDQPTTSRSLDKGFADIIEYHSNSLSGPEVQIIPTSQFKPSKKQSTNHSTLKYQDYAIILRRTWQLRGQISVPVRLELEIQSEPLCEELRKIAANHYETTDLESFPIKLQSPSEGLFFYRNEIQALTERTDIDSELQHDVKVLNNFIKNDGLLASIINDHIQVEKLGQVVSDILWTIYRPNSLVVLNVGIIRECWILRNVSIIPARIPGTYNWRITGLRLDFDGTEPVLAKQTFLTPMLGMHVTKISDLPIIPIQYYNDWSTLQPILEKRAVKLRKVLGEDLSSYLPQMYTGLSWPEPFSVYTEELKPTHFANQISERVVVDYKAYIAKNKNIRAEFVKLSDKGKTKVAGKRGKGRGIFGNSTKRCTKPDHSNSDEEMEEHDSDVDEGIAPVTHTAGLGVKANEDKSSDLSSLANLAQVVFDKFGISFENFELLFPALVPAFGLQSKKWLWLCSDSLEDVGWSVNAFESLQFDRHTKHLIESLVKGHSSKQATAFDDVISGKGRGLVFLLHGAPGLGKTLTAESVADYLKQPLYSISGGELSTNVTKVEDRLSEIFYLTKRWNAVTLLDEADVLLCKRNSTDIARNAIVGVFLRTIEYFQGVLFLTTNRKDDFDDAFKSRIHLTITYPELSKEAQAGIWKRFVENLERRDESWTNEVFGILGRLDLNGRVIKNILRTAVAYANGDQKSLGISHVLTILKTELKEYLEIDKLVVDKGRKEQVREAL